MICISAHPAAGARTTKSTIEMTKGHPVILNGQRTAIWQIRF
jgi:hypothetical protein